MGFADNRLTPPVDEGLGDSAGRVVLHGGPADHAAARGQRRTRSVEGAGA